VVEKLPTQTTKVPEPIYKASNGRKLPHHIVYSDALAIPF
jgi:hypothetical protein